MNSPLQLLLALTLTTGWLVLAKACPAGEFRNTVTGQCSPCPYGTFNSQENEFHNCRPCYKPKLHLYEIEGEPCTAIKDTEVLCSEDHYRTTSNDPQCMPCSICGLGAMKNLPENKTRCVNYTDTVCAAAGTSGKDTATPGMNLSTPTSVNATTPVNAAASEDLSWIIIIVVVEFSFFFIVALVLGYVYFHFRSVSRSGAQGKQPLPQSTFLQKWRLFKIGEKNHDRQSGEDDLFL